MRIGLSIVCAFSLIGFGARASPQRRAREAAEQPSGGGGHSTGQPTHAMRTIQVEGGYIRYEVLPDDDRTPPGQLFVVSAERAAPPRVAPEPARAERTPPPPPPPPLPQPARADQCREPRSLLAARVLELRGIEVSPELAVWLDRHPSFISDAWTPGIGPMWGSPLLATVQSDSVATDYAERLAHCEARQLGD